jgi:carboxyl-terminal processing protease
MRFPAVKYAVLILSLCLFATNGAVAQSPLTRQQYEADFDFLWQNISDDYAYFDKKATDWNRVREIHRPRIGAVKTQSDLIKIIEAVLEELYDFHTHLNTNTASSPRLVPSGADLWAEWKGPVAVITEVRPGSRAEEAGLRAGMQVLSLNGVAIDEATGQRLGRSLTRVDQDARNWALRALLAGRHNESRRIEVLADHTRRTVLIKDQLSHQQPNNDSLLEFRRLADGIGYIRIHNALGNTELIKEFDAALAALRTTRALILDLRDTPSGGNTTVARGIMGRFIRQEMPYQKHSIPAEERLYGTKRSWLELVSPRGQFAYTARVVVLVSHWTGSMGEGIAVGMDGIKRATIVGTRMAGLVGATSQITLPHTRIGVNFPTEKLFHVNGTPREDFIPAVYIDLLKRKSALAKDPVLDTGLTILRRRPSHDR